MASPFLSARLTRTFAMFCASSFDNVAAHSLEASCSNGSRSALLEACHISPIILGLMMELVALRSAFEYSRNALMLCDLWAGRHALAWAGIGTLLVPPRAGPRGRLAWRLRCVGSMHHHVPSVGAHVCRTLAAVVFTSDS